MSCCGRFGSCPSKCFDIASGLWSRLNRFWKRAIYLSIVLLLTGLTIDIFFWDSLIENSDRWHLPFLNPDPVSILSSPSLIFRNDRTITSSDHPIYTLLENSDRTFHQLLERRTSGVAAAAQAYRARRNRHPPLGFDEWVKFAEAHDSFIIEEFFDRIHHDIDPFWGISPHDIRASAASSPTYIRVRNGTASRSSTEQPFMNNYYSLVQRMEKILPDLDMPINHMDEPRVLVPWDTMTGYMQASKTTLQR